MSAKTIWFNGAKMTRHQMEELANEAARAAQRFDQIWEEQKARRINADRAASQ